MTNAPSNLAPPRSSPSVWEKYDLNRASAVSRWLMMVGASTFAGYAAFKATRRSPWLGVAVLSLAGASMTYAMREPNRRPFAEVWREWFGCDQAPDPVGQSSEDSFPASDPPASTPVSGPGGMSGARRSSTPGT